MVHRLSTGAGARIKAGVFEAMVHDLRELLRLAVGRKAQPSAAIFDSRTLQSTPESGGRAEYDGAKRRRGNKTHIAVDTLGNLLALLVTPANEQDRATVGELAEAVLQATDESVEIAYVDINKRGMGSVVILVKRICRCYFRGMNFADLLPAPQLLAFDNIVAENGSVMIFAHSIQTDVRCPACRTPATKRHSFYHRRLRDLPLAGAALQLRLRVRKFFCLNESCRRKVFVERLTNIADVFARRTLRVTTLLQHLAFYIGGRAGAKLSCQCALNSGKDTLLRLMRRRVLPPSEVPRVVGVDDFAFRRGRTYGTILVDLERRRAIDLLPDREAKTLTAWLQAHPGIEKVSRDRSVVYAEAVTVGAPKAEQVADRWHLLKNLSEQVERILLKHTTLLRDVAVIACTNTEEKQLPQAATVGIPVADTNQPAAIISPTQSRRRKLFDDLKRLQAEGVKPQNDRVLSRFW